jgi:GntP family gluconate:H+ symporter
MGPITIFILALIFILILTARLRVHPFLSLIAGSMLVGILAGETEGTMEAITAGMSSIFAEYAIVVTGGSIIGVILQRSGATSIIADDIIKIFKKPVLALFLLGFMFAVPMMCLILAFIIFIPVAKDLSEKLNLKKGVTEGALALGTMVSFGLIYPSPGIYAFIRDVGPTEISALRVLVTGILIAVPVSLAGYLYIMKIYNMKTKEDYFRYTAPAKDPASISLLPTRAACYAPIVIPVILILMRITTHSPVFYFIGNPGMALMSGAVIAMVLPTRKFGSADVRAWVEKGIRRSGLVMLDICGGGALGATLAMAGVGEAIGDMLLISSVPVLLIPFLIGAAIQTVQGSRMVSLFVASALVIPIMPQLGLPAEIVLFSMASGTFLISHFNDPFFWVLGDFADMETPDILKTYTMGGIVMGITSIAITSIIYFAFY